MGIVTTTTAANLIPSRWSPGLKLQATEAMRIAKNFNDAEGTSIMGTLYIRKVLAIASTNLPNATSGSGLTYASNTEQVVSITPTRDYAGVQIENRVIDRMDVSPLNAYRQQIALGLAAGMDANAGLLAASLSTTVVGSGAQDLDEALLLLAQARLVGAAKNKWEPGVSPAWLTVHPSQLNFLMGIFNLTAANVRGGSETPLVRGWISEALGMRLNVSGNVYQAAGVTHNLLHTDDAFAKAYNREPGILDPQPFDDTVKYLGVTEYGLVEQFDEYAADIQTRA